MPDGSVMCSSLAEVASAQPYVVAAWRGQKTHTQKKETKQET